MSRHSTCISYLKHFLMEMNIDQFLAPMWKYSTITHMRSYPVTQIKMFVRD